jgi:hypothetical protein
MVGMSPKSLAYMAAVAVAVYVAMEKYRAQAGAKR